MLSAPSSQFNAVRNMSITLRERQMREGGINRRLRKTAEESRRDFHLRSRGKLDDPYPGRALRKKVFEGVLDKILFTGPVRRGDPGIRGHHKLHILYRRSVRRN